MAVNPVPEATRVVIIGGGVAALEAMLAIRDLGGERVRVDIFAPRKDFVLKPLGVSEAFGQGEVLKYDLDSLARRSGSFFHLRSATSVEPDKKRVSLHDGSEIPYDYLVVATGTKALWVVPGAKTFWGLHGQEVVAEILEMISGSGPSRILLTMPEPAVWPLPIYELALFLTAEINRRNDLDAGVGVVTPESSPLASFGNEASSTVAEQLARNSISLFTNTTPVAFADGELSTSGGESFPADAVITLPRLTGRHLDGLPFNDQGFLPVDELGLISGLNQEFAAGDVISYPIKFGGVATEQADVVAAAIAHRAWDEPAPEPFSPVLEGTMLTADGPVHIGPGHVPHQTGGSEPWDPVTKVRGRHLSPFLKSEEK